MNINFLCKMSELFVHASKCFKKLLQGWRDSVKTSFTAYFLIIPSIEKKLLSFISLSYTWDLFIELNTIIIIILILILFSFQNALFYFLIYNTKSLAVITSFSAKYSLYTLKGEQERIIINKFYLFYLKN